MRGRVNPRRVLIDALAAVRRAQVEVRRAKARLSYMARQGYPLGEIRGLMENLEALDLVLERIGTRLTTILATGLLTKELLALPRELLEASSRLEGLPPSIMEALSEVGDLLDSVYQAAPSQSLDHAVVVEESVSREAEAILEEARSAARRRVEESLGS